MNFEMKINERLSLHLRHEDDAEELFVLIDKNRDHLRPWFPWVDTTLSPEDSKKFIVECQEKFQTKKAVDLAIIYDGDFVGSMGFHTIKMDQGWDEIGYWLGEDFQGKGIMTDCVKAVIDYGFKELTLHRIQIRCDSNNVRSKAIPERLGFTLEGVIREDHKHEDGTFSNGLVYGLLDNEWKGNFLS